MITNDDLSNDAKIARAMTNLRIHGIQI